MVKGDSVVDLAASGLRSLKHAIASGELDALAAFAADRDADLALSDVTLQPPIADPGKILCIGVNYMNRNAEYRDGTDAPKYPSVFVRFPESFVGHGQPLIRPPESEKLDYEGEIVLVIGKEGRRITEADATSHIAGFTIMNAGTIRDWVRHAKFNVTQGKNFDRTGSIGPWMVTPDEMPPLGAMTVRTTVNGELRQDDTTANMAFPSPFLVSYVSTFTTLKPGDLIATGTPTGAGARFDPPKFLKPGDVVEVEVPGIGTLSNGIADES